MLIKIESIFKSLGLAAWSPLRAGRGRRTAGGSGSPPGLERMGMTTARA